MERSGVTLPRPDARAALLCACAATTVTAAASSPTQQLRMADAKPCKGSVTASSQSSERASERKKARFMAGL